MSYSLTRTSMSLDEFTIKALDDLSKKWSISKAAVVRRAVRSLKEESDREDELPSPIEALDWLQNGGGLLAEEATEFRAEVEAERKAKKYWWEESSS
ncbi:MAG: hypothetical protein ACPG32_06195 [Akkermansiaceae bacterium]